MGTNEQSPAVEVLPATTECGTESGHSVVRQVGNDLRESADALRVALADALRRLEALPGETDLVALVADLGERFQQVHHDISGVVSALETPAAMALSGEPADK